MKLLNWRTVGPVLLFVSLVGPRLLRSQELDDLVQRARTEQAAGEYSHAAATYAKATELDPATPQLWANRGVMEYLGGDASASVASLKHALLLNPKLFTPVLFLGKAYVQMDKPDLALQYLEQAHTIRPNDVEVLLSLGKVSDLSHQQRRAATAYAEASVNAPNNTAAWFGLGVASLGIIEADGRDLARSHAESVWARALYADELFAQGRPLEALNIYKAVVGDATPVQLATLDRNVEYVQCHADLYPLPVPSQEPLQRLGLLLTAKKGATDLPPCNPVDAQSESHSSKPSAQLLGSAACDFWLGDYDRSASGAAQAMLQSPHNAEALYWSVKANERRAVLALSRFEELAPHSPATFDMVGDLYRHGRQPDSALIEYKKALAIDPRDPAAQLGAAAVYLATGDSEQAASLTQSALADRPLDPQLNLLMAELLVAKHQFTEAAAYLDKSLGAPPELLPRVHALIGRVDAEEGKTEEAIQQLELGIPCDEDGSLHYQLARLYRKTGNLAQAQKAEAGMKSLQGKRLANAMIAIKEPSPTSP